MRRWFSLAVVFVVGCGGKAALGPEGGAGSSGGSADASSDSGGAAGSANGDSGDSGDSREDADGAGPKDADGGTDDSGAASDADAAELGATWCSRGVDVPGVVPASGFCLKQYATVGEARAIVMAPNGDLFVSAPSAITPGGASGGTGEIVVLSDDDKDGVAESHTFLAGFRDVHGLALGGGYLYFTTQSTIFRSPYADGQRKAMGGTQDLQLPAVYQTGGRWTHGLALSAGGQLVTSRGAYSMCSAPMGGEISTVRADGSLATMASGFRNPMYLRCHRTAEVCAATELGEDLAIGAHEKMLRLRPNTNYGYPCCFGQGVPYGSQSTVTCGDVDQEDAEFPLSDTPFGFDWEPGNWPAPYTNGVFVALHGSAYSSTPWQGAGVVYAATDPTTHMPTQDWRPFQGGFGPGGSELERPADIAFSNDGRMFIADDEGGLVYWMAPVTLAAPSP